MIGLEHLDQRIAGWIPKTRQGRGGFGRFVTQRLQQAQHAPVMLRRADEHRHDRVVAQVLGQIAVDFLFGRNRVLKQLFEEHVVEIGQFLQQILARLFVAVPHVGGDFDQRGFLAGFVGIRPFGNEIDIAFDIVAVPDRNMAQNQRLLGHALKRFQHVLHRNMGMIDLVDEDHVRDVVFAKEMQQGSDHQRAVGIRIDDDDCYVGDHQGAARLALELDRPRAIQKSPAFAEKFGMGGGNFDAHFAAARFRGGIAHGGPVLHVAAAMDRAAGVQQGFEQGRLAAEIGSNNGGATR